VTKWSFPVGTEENSANSAGDVGYRLLRRGAIKSDRSVLTFQKNLLPPSGTLRGDTKLHTFRCENLNSNITADSQFGSSMNDTRRS
jgi:hypothetical protein